MKHRPTAMQLAISNLRNNWDKDITPYNPNEFIGSSQYSELLKNMNDNNSIEGLHDFIQVLFPVSPSCTSNEDSRISENPKQLEGDAKANFLRAVDIMCEFWGIDIKNGQYPIKNQAYFNAKLNNKHNHNHLRFTRMIHSIRLLLPPQKSIEFICGIEAVINYAVNITGDTKHFWKDALRLLEMTRTGWMIQNNKTFPTKQEQTRLYQWFKQIERTVEEYERHLKSLQDLENSKVDVKIKADTSIKERKKVIEQVQNQLKSVSTQDAPSQLNIISNFQSELQNLQNRMEMVKNGAGRVKEMPYTGMDQQTRPLYHLKTQIEKLQNQLNDLKEQAVVQSVQNGGFDAQIKGAKNKRWLSFLPCVNDSNTITTKSKIVGGDVVIELCNLSDRGGDLLGYLKSIDDSIQGTWEHNRLGYDKVKITKDEAQKILSGVKK